MKQEITFTELDEVRKRYLVMTHLLIERLCQVLATEMNVSPETIRDAVCSEIAKEVTLIPSEEIAFLIEDGIEREISWILNSTFSELN